MLYRITSEPGEPGEPGYLRADLFHRETADEATEFFTAVAASALRRRCNRVLISVHVSNALFTVDRSGFFREFTGFGGDPGRKIALVADSEEVDYSNAYIELLAQQQGLNVRHFRDEPAALEWLRHQNGVGAGAKRAWQAS